MGNACSGNAKLGNAILGNARIGNARMWHLIEDFFEQGVVVKLFILLGWLCVLIMVASFVASLVE